jgi:hypothetical protein
MKPLDSLKSWEQTSINARITNKDADEKANILRSSEQRPKMALRLTIPLDVAATAENPMLISQPFDGFYVEGATDAVTQVNLAMGAADRYATDNFVGLRINASAYYSQQIRGAYLTWSAQAAKIITIVFFLGVDYRPGSTVNSFTGTVSLIGGASTVTGVLGSAGNQASLTVTSATAVQLCQQNLSRGEFNFYTSADIWVGDSAVAVNRGILYTGGTNWSFANTGTLYAIAAAGNATVSGMEQRN